MVEYEIQGFGHLPSSIKNKGYLFSKNHRCGLTNQDLNRVWSMPDPKLNPEIYHTKNMLEYCVKALNKRPYMYIDYHGHCQERNFFVYGCHKSQSWNFKDIENTNLEPSMEVVESYAHVMSELSPFFSLNSCKFDILQHREGTARVAVWREFNISKSYTVETSICGTDRSSKKPHHFNIEHLKNIGADLMMGILRLFNLSELKLDLKVNEPLGDSTSGKTKLIDPITCKKFSLLKNSHDGDTEANNQDSDDSD